MDTTGKLIREGYIPKKQFLDLLAGVVIITYEALEEDLEEERNLRNTEWYGVYFKWLKDEAVVWWYCNRGCEPLPTVV